MKGKFPTIVMAVMALVLALSLAVVGAGVQTDEVEAGDLAWSTMTTPSIAIGIYPMVDIVGLELSPNYTSDSTIYASVNDPMKVILGAWVGTLGVVKSNNGGIMWTACTEPQNPVGVGPAAPLAISVAPDNVNFVVATDGYTVWVSQDGGGTWSVYGNAGALAAAAIAPVITSVDVGPAMAGTNPVAVGVNDTFEPLELIVTTALTGGAATTVTVTYTNSQGTVGRTGTALLPTGLEAIGAIVPVTLQGADTGALDVTAAVCSVADVTGVVNIRGTASATVAGTLTLTPAPGVYVDGLVIPAGALVDPNGVYLWGWGSPPSLSWSPQALAEDVWAVAFSPSYTADFTVVAAGSPAAATNVHLGDGSLSIAPPGNWDAAAIFGAGWPQALYAQVSTGACISLPSDFNGLLGGMQVAFVGTRGAALAANNDVWRVRNVGNLALGSGVAGVASMDMVGMIGGSAALMVGNTIPSATLPYANLAYTTDPWSAAPWWSGANKAPTGWLGMAIVALHPDYLTNGEAFCATGPAGGAFDESALSKTVNSGLTWNQISLIDTDVSVGIADLAPSPDYGTDSTLFVATSSAAALGVDSLWKSTMGGTIWERIDVFITTNNTAIVRVSPEYGSDDTIYWAETGAAANRIRVSSDDGGFFLTKTVGWAAGGINDMAVEDGTTLYVASGASVGKSADSASSWPSMGSAFGAARYLAMHAGTGDLFVSGDGIIYYVDTSTMTVSITGQITGEGVGTIQWLAFSDNYASDKTLYAAGAGAVGAMWKLTGVAGVMPASSTQLTLVPVPASGLEMSDEGVLYCADPAAWAPAAGGVLRTVNPEAEPVTFGTVPEFLRMTQGFAGLPAAPTLAAGAAGFDSMWMASDGTLFVRDTANPLMAIFLLDRILVYTDTLPMTPSPSSPADGATGAGIQVAAPMGAVMYYITLEWGAVSGAYGYGLQVDDGPDFGNPIVNIGIQTVGWAPTDPLSFWAVAPINQPATSYTTPAGAGSCLAAGACATALLVPGQEYFWRVRVDNTALGTGSAVGKWSSARSFTTGPGIAPDAPMPLSPEPGDTNVSARPGFSWSAVADATQYEFELSDEDGASVVTRTLDGLSYIYDLDDDLDEDATYSWSVRGINTATGFESPWSSATFTTGVPTATPIWVWIMIAIGAVVAIVVIVLIVRTRRPV
jgi:hypothetical protein